MKALEDFGFMIAKKDKNDDESDGHLDEVDEEDLKAVVDDLSYDEGGEEAGEEAIKELQAKGEK